MDALVVVLQILAAGVAGVVIGLEREIRGHPAGMRTHALIAVGAASFTAIGANGFATGDPARVAAQVVTGIGFVGAGAILREGLTVRGLTTAASLWATAAVGMAFAVGAYAVAVTVTVVVVVTLAWVRSLRPLVDRLGFTRMVITASYSPGHGTLGPLLRTLDSEHTHLVDLQIDDRNDPDPVRIVHIELRVAKPVTTDVKATAMTLGEEYPEIKSVEVDVA